MPITGITIEGRTPGDTRPRFLKLSVVNEEELLLELSPKSGKTGLEIIFSRHLPEPAASQLVTVNGRTASLGAPRTLTVHDLVNHATLTHRHGWIYVQIFAPGTAGEDALIEESLDEEGDSEEISVAKGKAWGILISVADWVRALDVLRLEPTYLLP